MSTTCYLRTGSQVPPVLPNAGSQWGVASSLTRRMATLTKGSGGGILADFAAAETSASATNVVTRMFLTDALAAQTITGTFDAVVRCFEAAASADASLQVVIRLINPQGTQRSVLYAGHSATLNTTADALGQEMGTAASTRIMSGVSLTNQTAEQGDYLSLEFGWRAHNTTATSQSASLRFGDVAGTADFALTSGLTTDLNPWLRLSHDLVFAAPRPGRIVPSAAVARSYWW